MLRLQPKNLVDRKHETCFTSTKRQSLRCWKTDCRNSVPTKPRWKFNVKKSLIALSIGIFASMMTGCAWLKQPELVPPLQANLLRKCPEFLSEHTGSTGAAALGTLTRWPSEYNDCAARHNGLVDALVNKDKK